MRLSFSMGPPTGRQVHPVAGQPMLAAPASELKFSPGGELLVGLPVNLRIGRSPIERVFLSQSSQRFAAARPGQTSLPLRRGVAVWEVANGRLLWEALGASLVLANADESRLAGIVSTTDAENELSHAAVVWNRARGRNSARSRSPPIARSPDSSLVRMAAASPWPVAATRTFTTWTLAPSSSGYKGMLGIFGRSRSTPIVLVSPRPRDP